jgi:NAD(P)H-flavin reductase
VVSPLNPWLNWSATIARVTQESPGVATYDLVIDDPQVAERYAFQPGQFNMIYLPGVGEVAISISGDPGDTSCLPHTIREAGNVTRSLAQIGQGGSIGVRGPFGSSWPMQECVGKDIILVAGGIGMAPLRPVVCEMLADRDRYGSIALLYGARTADGLLYPQQMETWQAEMDVQRTVDRATPNWQGHVGVVTALLERLDIPDPQNTVLLTCGPEVMMWYTIQTARGRGIVDTSIWVSLERNMNCAVGFCGHCQLGPEFLCKDGPVFRYDRVASILKVEGL